MPDDAGPGELDQVGVAVAAEYPVVVPELIELAEIPVDDPGLRLVRVAPCGPFVEQLPQVMVQAGEYSGRDHPPVVGCPAALLWGADGCQSGGWTDRAGSG